mgnify:CR=1 FL=1
MERLQKVIAAAGIASRRKAEELIVAGKVTVNGEVVKTLGTKVNGEDIITVNGRQLAKESYEYYLLNKPREYICSVNDEFKRKVVTDLIATNKRIYPVGRLDYDTTGLLILTNDGTLANILMHPKNGVEKTYVAKIEGNLSMEELHKLKMGIVIDGVLCKPLRVKIKKHDIVKCVDIVEVVITEGRNHIVKNLFKAVNHEVIKLKREKYGFLELGNLKSGEYRPLSIKEVHRLYAYKK